MTGLWTTTELPGLDCDPAWSNDYQPNDRTPSRFDLRQHEMRDLRDQGAGPGALWNAHNVPTGDLL